MGQALRRGDGATVQTGGNTASLFSDDFGGNAVNAGLWTVLPGGLPSELVGPPGQQTQQAAIGSGQMTAMNYSVANSALTVAMGTTSGDELWLLSNRTFAASEDITLVMSKSQFLAANSIFIGLVEVDPVSGWPLLNPNLAGDFTNRGGVEFGTSTSGVQIFMQAVADSSPAVAQVSVPTWAAVSMSTVFEAVIEIHAEDIIASYQSVDAVTGKNTPARVSSQCPNDTKAYKLLMRFRNVAGPASNTNVAIQRLLVVENQEMRVEVTSGRGDTNVQKGLAVNITGGAVTLGAGSASVGLFNPSPQTTFGCIPAKVVGAASGFFKATKGNLYGWDLLNTQASARFLQIYNKSTAGIPGTDTPVYTIPLGANGMAQKDLTYGILNATGLAWAITTDAAGATIGASGDVVGGVYYE